LPILLSSSIGIGIANTFVKYCYQPWALVNQLESWAVKCYRLGWLRDQPKDHFCLSATNQIVNKDDDSLWCVLTVDKRQEKIRTRNKNKKRLALVKCRTVMIIVEGNGDTKDKFSIQESKYIRDI